MDDSHGLALAGDQSTRMDLDKELMLLAGQPLLVRAANHPIHPTVGVSELSTGVAVGRPHFPEKRGRAVCDACVKGVEGAVGAD